MAGEATAIGSSIALDFGGEQACCDLCYTTTQPRRCLYYSFSSAGECQLYSGASTGPASAREGWVNGAVPSTSAPPTCSITARKRCTPVASGGPAGQLELGSVQLPPNQPYLCCLECAKKTGCVDWNFAAAGGACTLLAAGACASAVDDAGEARI